MNVTMSYATVIQDVGERDTSYATIIQDVGERDKSYAKYCHTGCR